MKRFKAVVLANARLGGGRPSFVRHEAIQLVPVANKPILFYALEALRDAEIVDVAVVVNPQAGDEIREAVGDGSAWGLRISYIKRRPLGLIDALHASECVLRDSPFVVYPGSGILPGPLQPVLRRFHTARLQALLPLRSAEARGSGEVAVMSGDPVARALTRLADGCSTLTNDGVSVFGPAVHAAARAAARSWRGQLELAEVIHIMLEGNARVEARSMDAWWAYHGHAHELLEGNRLLLDRLIGDRENAFIEDSTIIQGRVAISASANVESTTIRGPAIIGPGARLADAYIGPYTSVGPAAVVHGVEVENSILMAGVELKDVRGRIAGSIIGEHATVNRDFRLPRVLELAVAHGSTAMLG